MTIPCPSLSYTEEMSWDVAQTDPALGAVLVGMPRDNPIRIHHLTFLDMPTAERDQLVTEYDTAKGSAGVVTTFTPPDDGGAVDCYFADEQLTETWRGPDRFEVRCRLVEVKPVLV